MSLVGQGGFIKDIVHFKTFSSEHPDPGSIVNVRVWKTGASAFWDFFGTVHFTDASKDPRCSSVQK